MLAQLCSLAAYAPFLWNTTPVPLAIAAVGEAVVLAGAIWATATSIRDDVRKGKAEAAETSARAEIEDGDPHQHARA